MLELLQNRHNFDILNLIIGLCSTSLIIAVFIDFVLYEEKKNTNSEKRSKVATGNMFGFFGLVYLILVFRLGRLEYTLEYKDYIRYFGLCLIIIGTLFNIIGRFYLKNNWANHIKIYDDHFLVSVGPYRIVRHPLYASLIWFSYGVGLAYSNWLIIVVTSVIFVPMMIYRAGQEEEMLAKQFENYREYKKKTGMFLPKLF